jgi:hypothetical protein
MHRTNDVGYKAMGYAIELSVFKPTESQPYKPAIAHSMCGSALWLL